jgi:glycine cleavage system H protein
MAVPADLKYTESHEWVRREADGLLSVGITDYAQEALGDMVFVELPAVGRRLAKGEACGVVESVKAASDIYAPVAGEVVASNTALADKPELVNADAFGAWLFRLKPENPADVDALLDAAKYQATLDAKK